MSEIKQGKCEECGKDYKDILTVCGHCGYSPHGSFTTAASDPYWKCGNCGRTVQAANPPERCPGCGEICDFKNVTCYDPACGGPGNSDPRL
ncbi:MAG: hypothetical protein PHZ02_02375 [Desulfocapsaceae bacterium]|nr:hypothetical protein [Desulfocapsaceae bacterium]